MEAKVDVINEVEKEKTELEGAYECPRCGCTVEHGDDLCDQCIELFTCHSCGRNGSEVHKVDGVPLCNECDEPWMLDEED